MRSSVVSTVTNPVSCEVHSVICFLNPKGVSGVQIYCQSSEVYGPDVISGVQELKNGLTNVHDKERSSKLINCRGRGGLQP